MLHAEDETSAPRGGCCGFMWYCDRKYPTQYSSPYGRDLREDCWHRFNTFVLIVLAVAIGAIAIYMEMSNNELQTVAQEIQDTAIIPQIKVVAKLLNTTFLPEAVDIFKEVLYATNFTESLLTNANITEVNAIIQNAKGVFGALILRFRNFLQLNPLPQLG